jgi:SRSO17 transposase
MLPSVIAGLDPAIHPLRKDSCEEEWMRGPTPRRRGFGPAGIQPKILVWPPGTGPKRRGKPINNTGRRDEPDLISAKHLARDLPKDAWQTIRWREGSAEWLSSRFARVRVRVAHSQLLPELLAQEWLLIEWPEGEAAPTKY